jgi:hypothetical protein
MENGHRRRQSSGMVIVDLHMTSYSASVFPAPPIEVGKTRFGRWYANFEVMGIRG